MASMADTSRTRGTLFVNGLIFQYTEGSLDGQATFADAMYIHDGKILDIGSKNDVLSRYLSYGSVAPEVRDLDGRTVLPGFVDGHMHLLTLGQSLQKLDLGHCKSLDDIQSSIKSYAAEKPEIKRILCQGWMHSMTSGKALASMLNELDPRPIFIDSKDLHSTWCNDAALVELGVADTPDPPGGKIHRDESGRPSGLLEEAAVLGIVWPHQANKATVEERIQSIRAAVAEYHAAGYTGIIEMAMDEAAWEALRILYTQEPDFAMRIAAYWLIKPAKSQDECFSQVDRAVELRNKFNQESSPNLRIVGIKIICDGIIDACTAFMAEPYAGTTDSPTPVWTETQLAPVVAKADGAELQIALHAIGDAAVKLAVDVLEKNCAPGRRHRIEHLELASAEDALRLGKLGITASIQPVHADPAILRAWPRLLGEHRCGRAFAYREFADGGATLAIGSDSPSAPWNPLANMYVACTRKSAREPSSGETVNEKFKLSLYEAVVAATSGAAESVFAEKCVGRLTPGLLADFVVLDAEWDANLLLRASVKETWFEGKQIWSARS